MLLNYLPVLLLTIFVSWNLGFLIRIRLEGANNRTAVLTLFRFYAFPIAMLVFITKANENYRKILYEYKQSDDYSDERYKQLEDILKSKWKILWLFITIFYRFFRLLLEVFIQASIEFERNKKKLSRRKNNKTTSFYDNFINDIDIGKHIFS